MDGSPVRHSFRQWLIHLAVLSQAFSLHGLLALPVPRAAPEYRLALG
jgi:hypothetical protein